jgi:hypothetical protein
MLVLCVKDKLILLFATRYLFHLTGNFLEY